MLPSVSQASTCPYARKSGYCLDATENPNPHRFRIAVWSQNKILIVGLVLVIMGHWSLLLHGKRILVLKSLYAAADSLSRHLTQGSVGARPGMCDHEHEQHAPRGNIHLLYVLRLHCTGAHRRQAGHPDEKFRAVQACYLDIR